MEKLPYACPKCANARYSTGEIRTSGGLFSSLFDYDNQRFSYVSCSRCSYTEFYKTRVGNLAKVVDFLMS